MILLLLAAQAATPASAPAAPADTAPTSFSILEPVGNEPCVRRGKDGRNTANPDDIIVCGKPIPSQKLPYPNEVVLDRPMPSNPYLTGTGALAVESSTPCSSVQRGCTTGIDLIGGSVKVVRLIQKAVSPDSCCERPGEAESPILLGADIVHGIKHAFRKKPDKSGRVSIALDDAPPKSVILP